MKKIIFVILSGFLCLPYLSARGKRGNADAKEKPPRINLLTKISFAYLGLAALCAITLIISSKLFIKPKKEGKK